MSTPSRDRSGRHGDAQRARDHREVRVVVDLDGSGAFHGAAVVPHLDHMLGALARHAFFDITVECVADPIFEQAELALLVGECAGAALSDALFDRTRVARIGSGCAPLEDALVRVAVDVTGRPHLRWRLPKLKAEVVDPLSLFRFLQGFVREGGMTAHVDLLAAGPCQHVFQATYRALGAALRAAVAERPHGPPPSDPHGEL